MGGNPLPPGPRGADAREGAQRPPTSWWMLSMARLYLSQSLCMLSKLKGKGKRPVAVEPSTRHRGLAGLSGETAPGQAAPAVP